MAHLLTQDFCFPNVFLKLCYFLISFSLQKEEFKQKHKTGKCGPLIGPAKGQTVAHLLTLQHMYMCIYIYGYTYVCMYIYIYVSLSLFHSCFLRDSLH